MMKYIPIDEWLEKYGLDRPISQAESYNVGLRLKNSIDYWDGHHASMMIVGSVLNLPAVLTNDEIRLEYRFWSDMVKRFGAKRVVWYGLKRLPMVGGVPDRRMETNRFYASTSIIQEMYAEGSQGTWNAETQEWEHAYPDRAHRSFHIIDEVE